MTKRIRAWPGLIILLSTSLYAQEPHDKSAGDKYEGKEGHAFVDKVLEKLPANLDQERKNTPQNLGSEIYDITFNNNWKFSALSSFDKDNVYIPLRYLPSEVLGNLTDTFMVEKGERSLIISRNLIQKLDSESLLLEINLGEAYFKSQNIEATGQRKKYGTPINALFMNYDLNIPLQKIQDTRGVFDFNWSSQKNWVARNGLLWNGSQAVRLNTTWRKQFDDNSILMVGDTFGNTIPGFNSLNFFGGRYASAYYNSGSYINTVLPTIPISGFAVNPSKLDIYLNNQLIQSSDINSGRYNLNYPLQRQGYGIAQAFVYDLTGKPVVVSVPFYGNNEVIRPGEHAYDLSAGMIRKNYGTQSFDYQSFVGNALYKRGIAKGYTQDFYAQYSPLYSVASTLSHWIPYPRLGKFSLGYSYNSLGQQLTRLGFERNSANFSLGGTLEKSKEFCYGFNQACIKAQAQLFTGFPLPNKWGSVSSNYVSRQNNMGKNDIVSLQWNKQINRDINLFANISRNKNNISNNIAGIVSNANASGTSFYVGLSWNLGGGIYSSTSLSKAPTIGNNIQQSLYVAQREENPELGFGSLTYSRNDAGDQTSNAYYGAKLKNLSYQINAYKDNRATNINAGITGAIAYIPEDNYFSFNRQMQNGLTYIKVENVDKPTPILHENKLSGYSDKLGRYMVPDSIALNTETVSIDINKLPKDITIEDYKKEYYIPFSGAVRVDFKAKPLPYVVYIKGVKPGAIFNIDKDYYVVGENGQTAIDANGEASIPLEDGRVCKLSFTSLQKNYDCSK